MQIKPNYRQSYHRTPGGLNLSFRMWGGSGPPDLLLVHGFGDNALVWSHFVSELEDSCCALAVDLRGHGHSEWDPAGTYALSDLVGDVVNVLDQLCPAPVVLVGHSLGAQIAMRVATARRERIRAVVLVDFALRPDELPDGYVLGKFRERQRTYASAAEYVAFLRKQLPLAREQLLETLAEGVLRVTEDGRCQEMCDPRLANREEFVDTQAILAALKGIARPLLFARGAASAVLSRATAQELLAQLPQSRMSVVAAAGHAVMLDNPEGFCSAVRPYVLRFLSGPRGQAADRLPSCPEGLLEPSSARETP